MKTVRGIELDLMVSEYNLNIGGIIFYFSSKLYLDKFKDTVDEYVKNETIKIQAKYGLNVNLEIFLKIAYYKKIEKRGFRVYDSISKKEIDGKTIFINSIMYNR